MPSIVQDYYVPGDKFSEYIILVILLILVIGTWTLILYFSSSGTTTVTGGITKAYLTCEPTYCPTLKTTGEKRCPTNQALGLTYDPQFEVCNPPYACTAFETPYAYNSDGSVNYTGKCEPNITCRCVDFLSTPSYIQSIFQVNGDSLYTTNLKGTSNTFITQISSPYAGQGNNIPIIYNDYTRQFWNISPSLLYYFNQSPCAEKFAEKAELNNPEMLQCINQNPCINGTMAYVTDNSTEYITAVMSGNKFKINQYNLACVVDSVENTPQGLTLYLDSSNQTYSGSTLNGTFTTTLNTGTQTSISSGNITGNTITIAQFLTASNTLPSKNIVGGNWTMNLYASSSETSPTSTSIGYRFRAFYVDADGVSNKTYISPDIDTYTAVTTQNLYTHNLTVNSTTLPDLTKRVGVEIVTRIGVVNGNITIKFRDSTVSNVHTTIDTLLRNTCLTKSGYQYAPFFNPMTGRVHCYETDILTPS